LKVAILFPHKVKNEAFRTSAEQYLRIAGRFVPVDLHVQPLADRQGRLHPAVRSRLAGAEGICLSEHGTAVDSDWFLARLERARQAGQDLVFVIGDADGYPKELESLCRERIALSPLTLPHELALVILAEQLWRAAARAAKHPYHRG
jgi:rRNA large subunit m3Psi methyltransferase RlmH